MNPQHMNPEDVTDESVYDHGFNDAIDKVLEIIERLNHNGSVSIKLLRKELEALKSGMCL